MRICFLILALFVTGCSQKLSIRTEYLTDAYLASSHVGTPDLRRGSPLVGQQLIVSWYIPSALWHGQELTFDTTVRFRNNEEWHKSVSYKRQIGTFLYQIQDEDFLKKGGILTYKVLLYEDGILTEEWLHPLWQERIVFNQKAADREGPCAEDECEPCAAPLGN